MVTARTNRNVAAVEEKTAEQQLEEFRQKVRTTAIKVARDQSWCDDGLNEVLRDLGLREKQDIRIPVEVITKQTRNVIVSEAATEEEAYEIVQTPEWARANFGPGTQVRKAELRDPDSVVVGDLMPEGAYDRVSQCRAPDAQSGYRCTRSPGHGGRQHVSGNADLVYAVWPVV